MFLPECESVNLHFVVRVDKTWPRMSQRKMDSSTRSPFPSPDLELEPAVPACRSLPPDGGMFPVPPLIRAGTTVAIARHANRGTGGSVIRSSLLVIKSHDHRSRAPVYKHEIVRIMQNGPTARLQHRSLRTRQQSVYVN